MKCTCFWIWGSHSCCYELRLMLDLRFSQCGYEDFYLLGYNNMQSCESSDVSDEHIASIFMVDD
jgi:hypothetical protein